MRSRTCNASRVCSTKSASVASERGSGFTTKVYCTGAALPAVIFTLYVPGAIDGPVPRPPHKIMPRNVVASG